MKTIVCLMIVFVSSLLCAVDLINEVFSNPPNIPAGWYATGPNTSVWSVANSNNAGGTAGELKFLYNPSAVGTYRFISPVVDTRKVHDMNLSFRHALNDYPSSVELYTIGVQISNDLVNWTTLWSVTTTNSIPATLMQIGVSFAYGRSASTHIAFFFQGNNNDLNQWYIDNVVLSYNDTLGDGVWQTGNYTAVGNIIVPDGCTFGISPGTVIQFPFSKQLIIRGNLIANGNQSQPVTLKGLNSDSNWYGIHFDNVSPANDSSLIVNTTVTGVTGRAIYLQNSAKIRFSNCKIENNFNYSSGALFATNSSFILEHSTLRNNNGSTGASALGCSGGQPTIRHCTIVSNITNNAVSAAVELNGCNLDLIHDNVIGDNYRDLGSSSIGLMLMGCTGTLRRMLIACNTGSGITINNTSLVTLDHCIVAYNGNQGGYGIYQFGVLNVNNSIIWGNYPSGIYNGALSSNVQVRYSCLQLGTGGVDGNAMNSSNFISSIYSDPLFNPSPTGSISSVWLTDWRLQYNSPCINTADPASPLDADGSRADMGVYPRLLRPVITRAMDFFPDQGHQLDLCWNPSDFDASFQPNAYYSIWRQGTPSRDENTVWISNPGQLSEALDQGNGAVYLNHDNRTWYYLAQIPALGFESYGMVVPTPIDSSAAGLNANAYFVAYNNNYGYWISAEVSGYSVDNIAPIAASGLVLQTVNPGQLKLSWFPVTEGMWEGNSYPEINTITYKVFAGDSPDFPLDNEHYLCSTTTPQVVFSSLAGTRKFYRIIASDSD